MLDIRLSDQTHVDGPDLQARLSADTFKRLGSVVTHHHAELKHRCSFERNTVVELLIQVFYSCLKTHVHRKPTVFPSEHLQNLKLIAFFLSGFLTGGGVGLLFGRCPASSASSLNLRSPSCDGSRAQIFLLTRGRVKRDVARRR